MLLYFPCEIMRQNASEHDIVQEIHHITVPDLSYLPQSSMENP